MAVYTTASGSFNKGKGFGWGEKCNNIGRDSASIKLCGYYTFLKGVLAKLLSKVNFARFLP